MFAILIPRLILHIKAKYFNRINDSHFKTIEMMRPAFCTLVVVIIFVGDIQSRWIKPLKSNKKSIGLKTTKTEESPTLKQIFQNKSFDEINDRLV